MPTSGLIEDVVTHFSSFLRAKLGFHYDLLIIVVSLNFHKIVRGSAVFLHI